MKFKVTTISNSGEKTLRSIEASSKTEVFSILKEQNLTPISVTEENQKNSISFEKLNLIVSTVKMNEKITFARNLGSMIEAGLPISRALSVIERQTKNPKFKNILIEVQDDIRQGNSLSASLLKHPSVFSSIFTSMVKAGEESGGLSESLKLVSLQMEKTYLLKKKIKGAMMYPGIIIFAMLLVGALMMIYVVPTLTQTFKELNVDLPFSTQIIIFISDLMKNYSLLMLLVLLALIGGLYALVHNPKGKRAIDYIFIKMPVISGMVFEANAAQTTRTLSSLLSSGVEVVTALDITRDVLSNSYYKDVLKKASEDVQKGVLLSKIFDENNKIYPVFVSEMVSVGEETGKLPEMLQKVAIFYEEDIDQKTKNMSTIIEPFLMILIGGAVGFFALSMISPTYSLIDGL
jgi:type IV pilus assembly protein PilC